MPIPSGARQVPGSPNRIQLSSGEIVTRARARTLGAQEVGYRSEYDYRRSGRASGDANWFKAFLNSPQGQHAASQARSQGKSMTDLRQEAIRARNDSPSKSGKGKAMGTPGRPAGQSWYEFMEEYDLYDYEDFIRDY